MVLLARLDEHPVVDKWSPGLLRAMNALLNFTRTRDCRSGQLCCNWCGRRETD